MNGFRSFQFLLLFVFRLAIFYFTPLTLFCNVRVEFAKYETIYFSLKYENNALTYSYKIYERTTEYYESNIKLNKHLVQYGKYNRDINEGNLFPVALNSSARYISP